MVMFPPGVESRDIMHDAAVHTHTRRSVIIISYPWSKLLRVGGSTWLGPPRGKKNDDP